MSNLRIDRMQRDRVEQATTFQQYVHTEYSSQRGRGVDVLIFYG